MGSVSGAALGWLSSARDLDHVEFQFSGLAGLADPGTTVWDGAAASRFFPLARTAVRLSLPEVHRRVSEWLRCAAIREVIALALLERYCSPRLQL